MTSCFGTSVTVGLVWLSGGVESNRSSGPTLVSSSLSTSLSEHNEGVVNSVEVEGQIRFRELGMCVSIRGGYDLEDESGPVGGRGIRDIETAEDASIERFFTAASRKIMR